MKPQQSANKFESSFNQFRYVHPNENYGSKKDSEDMAGSRENRRLITGDRYFEEK